jgi:putative glutamine amidotransferase
MKKPLNVHFSANIIDDSVIRFLSKDFELNIVNISEKELKNPNPELTEKIKNLDLIILTGGEDVDPESYGQETGKYTHVNKKRDSLEFELLYPEKISQAFIKKIPKLGICRGAQLLTVYSGGTLIQHVEGHKNNEQIIDIGVGSQKQMVKQISIASDHHQMMFPYNLNENNYELIGWSSHFQSNTYLNGRNEEIKLPKDFLEPEIVYYKGTNSLCIQSHPEWCIDSEGSNYCLSLIHKYLFKNEIKEPLPAGLPEGEFPLGYAANDITGKIYRFDGEKFITNLEYTVLQYSKKEKKPESYYEPVALGPLSTNSNSKYGYIPNISPGTILINEEHLNNVDSGLDYYKMGMDASDEEQVEKELTKNNIEF